MVIVQARAAARRYSNTRYHLGSLYGTEWESLDDLEGKPVLLDRATAEEWIAELLADDLQDFGIAHTQYRTVAVST